MSGRPTVAAHHGSRRAVARFEEELRKELKESFPLHPGLRIIARTKADSLFTAVAAASIVAKTERDRAMQALSRRYAVSLGSGYTSDLTTRAFLSQSALTPQLPSEAVRQTWKLKPMDVEAARAGRAAATAGARATAAVGGGGQRKAWTKKPPPALAWEIITE